VFKIEDEIIPLLTLCKQVLVEKPKFLIFSCHTPGFTPIVLSHLLKQVFGKTAEFGEMLLSSETCFSIPSGAYARIVYD
jgi:23S rRNA (cytosine1962-C5)-methyltransferase